VDLAIVDVMLSGPMDGIALAGELRARHRDIGVIFVSGSGDAETRARIAAARPIAFLQKPFRPSELQALIEARAARAGLA
jgi:DNA-binding response OmpR family regulator